MCPVYETEFFLYICPVLEINSYIHIEILADAQMVKSYCKTTTDDAYLHLRFGLAADDYPSARIDQSYLISIRVAQDYFQKYGQSFQTTVHHQEICFSTFSRLLDIIQCDLSGLHRQIYLESIVLYLLFQSQRNSLIFQSDCDSCISMTQPADTSMMQQAHDHILQHLATSLSIASIARAIGTNQCYLKKSFKEYYGQTIFEFIQEKRMALASQLLSDTSHSITDISARVGYASLSSFSQAYKNYFGISPSRKLSQNIADN